MDYQKAGEIQLIEAKEGTLTRRAYYEENKQRLKDMIFTRLTILHSSTGTFLDHYNYSQEKLEKIISDYIDTICNNVELDKLKEMQKQFVSFSLAEEVGALDNFVNNAIDYSENHSEITLDTMGGEGKPLKIKNPKGIVPSYWDSAEPITFEEVYKIERGVEYSQYKVEQYVLAKTEMETVANAYNKKQQFVNTAKSIMDDKSLTVDGKLQKIMALYSEFYAMSDDNGLSELKKIVDSSNTLIKFNGSELDLSAYLQNDQMKQSALNKLLSAAIFQKEQDFKDFLGGKSIEEYQEAFEQAANDILGDDNAKMLADAMKNDNMTMIQRYTGNASMAGMGITVIGGILCFTPLAPLGAVMVTTGNVLAVGGMAAKTGLGVADYATKDVKTAEELEDLTKDFIVDAGGFIIGMGAGKAGMKAFSKLIDKKLSAVFAKEITAGNRIQALQTVLKNPTYLKNFMTAAGAKIGTDFMISYVGDLAMMGMLDTNEDWKSLLQANLTGILIGTSGDIKDLAGVGKSAAKVRNSSGTTTGKPLTQQEYGISVLGKEVTVKDAATGAETTGTVTSVNTKNGEVSLEINGKAYSTDDVIGATEQKTAPAASGPRKITQEEKTLYDKAVSLIGTAQVSNLVSMKQINNPNEYRFSIEEIYTIAETAKIKPKLCNTLLNAATVEGTYRFNAFEIKAICEAVDINLESVKKVLNTKTADGKKYKHNGFDIKAFVEAEKADPEFVSKNMNKNWASGTALKSLIIIKQTQPELFKVFANATKSLIPAEEDFANLAIAAAENPNIVKKLLNFRTKDGKFLFTGNTIAKYAKYLNEEVFSHLMQKANESKISIITLLHYHSALEGNINDTEANISRIIKAREWSAQNDCQLSIKAINKNYTIFQDKEGKLYKIDSQGRIITNAKEIQTEEFVNNEGNINFEVSNSHNYSIKSVTDSSKNLLYKEYRIPSKEYPEKFEIWRKTADGKKYNVALIEETPNGITTIEKTLTSPEGIKTDYFYAENPADNSRMTYHKITDKDGSVIFENRQKFKILDENHFQSVENGKSYDIQYFDDKVVVIRDDGEKVEIPIGENEVDKDGVFSRELVPLLKQLPGSMYFNYSKYKITKIGRNIDGVKSDNAFYRRSKNLIALSDMHSQLFTLLHESGHYIDSQKAEMIRTNQELLDIYNKEKEAFWENESSHGVNKTSYFIDGMTQSPADGIGELIAETNALLYSNNTVLSLEQRGMYLQEYFPRTFAKIAELLTQD